MQCASVANWINACYLKWLYQIAVLRRSTWRKFVPFSLNEFCDLNIVVSLQWLNIDMRACLAEKLVSSTPFYSSSRERKKYASTSIRVFFFLAEPLIWPLPLFDNKHNIPVCLYFEYLHRRTKCNSIEYAPPPPAILFWSRYSICPIHMRTRNSNVLCNVCVFSVRFLVLFFQLECTLGCDIVRISQMIYSHTIFFNAISTLFSYLAFKFNLFSYHICTSNWLHPRLRRDLLNLHECDVLSWVL